MYAVLGVSGQTGGAVAGQLLAAGEAVRVVVRDAAKAAPWLARGAEVAVAAVDDADALARAFDGVAGAYVLNPPAYTAADPFARAIDVAEALATAADKAGVPHVVALSSVGGHQTAGTGIIGTAHILEQRLMAAAAPLTVVRAAYFIENWGAVLGLAKAQGILPAMLSPLDRPFPMVATADIGALATEALRSGPDGKRVWELRSGAWSVAEVASVLTAALGKTVAPVAVPREAWAEALAPAGFSPAVLAAFIAMYDGINDGTVAFAHPATVRQGATTLAQVLGTLLG